MIESGVVEWFDVKKGMGFIKRDNKKKDAFVHFSKIISEEGEFKVLEKGQRVEFLIHVVERDGEEKPQAKDVKVLS